MKHLARALLCAATGVVAACNVESRAVPDRGIGERPEGECPAGVSVVLTDFFSTQIALSGLDGHTESESVISSGSSSTDGLSFALSGDVTLPSVRPDSGRVVVIDRYGTNVITWLDPSDARVLGQLAVGTGFESNPADYLEVQADRAWITRWGQNPAAGAEPFDRGGDVLLIDPQRQEIVGSIELPIEDDLPPRPSGMTRQGDHVLVSLTRVAKDFKTTGDFALASVRIPTGTVDAYTRFDGLKNCGRATPSPDGALLVFACSGAMNTKGLVADISQSALVVLDATQTPPGEIRRFPAVELAGESLQTEVEFASNTVVLFKTQTEFQGERNNRLLSLNLEHETAVTVLEARPNSKGQGKGIVFGGISCAPGCSTHCLLADADQGVLQRITLDTAGAPQELVAIRVEDNVGLPPRGLTLR